MTDTQSVETDQSAREASGSHPYGRYLEEFEVGAVYKHWPAKTVTEAEDHLFCLLTMNSGISVPPGGWWPRWPCR